MTVSHLKKIFSENTTGERRKGTTAPNKSTTQRQRKFKETIFDHGETKIEETTAEESSSDE